MVTFEAARRNQVVRRLGSTTADILRLGSLDSGYEVNAGGFMQIADNQLEVITS